MNKPVVGRDLFKKKQGKKENETNIRTTGDLVSFLDKNSDFTIPSKSLNPLAEHSTDVMKRTDKEFGKSDVGKAEEKSPSPVPTPVPVVAQPKKLVGSIFSRKGVERMTKRGLKDIIKALPKAKDGFKLVGAGKPQLVDYICKRCGK